jgi:hypothetical protein
MVQAKRLASLEELLGALSGGAPAGNPEPSPPPGPTPSAVPHPPAVIQDSRPPASAAATTQKDRIREVAAGESPLVASMLGQALEVAVAGDELKVRFAAGQRGHCEILQDPEKLGVIERAGSKLEGRRLRVSLLLEEDQSPVEVSPPPEVPPLPQEESESRDSQRILEDERVQRFLKVFEGVSEVRKLK